MVESDTLKKQKVQEQIDTQVARELEEQLEREDQRRYAQIARDAEIARIHVKEELQIMIDGLDRNNETGMAFEEVEAKFNSVWKQMEDFIPIGSKEEAERIKRKGINLEQETKKQKISEEVTKKAKTPNEVPGEKVKEMMQLVPIEEVFVEALQVKHPIIDCKIVMENPNHLNELNEAIPKMNPVVPEPNQDTDIHDPNEMVNIPDDIDLVDYEEEEPEEDVDIELEDDAELIFPYEVEGDKTPLPGDVSSNSMSSESESEDEEVDVAPEATAGTTTQNPYAIRDFSRGLFEVEESFSSRDSSNVDGLAPWALRRDLKASRARARVIEAKLGNVLERMSVLESMENATLKKRLAETETKLVWARIERETAKRRTGGAGAGGAGAGGAGADGARADGAGAGGVRVCGARPLAPKITGCTYITFMKCEPHPFKGTKGEKVDDRGILSSKYVAKAGARIIQLKLKGTDIDGYTNRFHELVLLYPRMMEPEQVKVEQYIHGLSKNIRGDVTSSRPAGIDEAVCMAYQLIGQIIQDKTDEVSEGEKRKGKGDRGGRGDN
nr:hypothetical protein [Tanacetum cinerariifolium]